MKKPFNPLFALYFCLISTVGFSQTCECTDCPVDILDVQTVTSVLDVSGLTNGTLNSGGQGICEVSLQYEHSWISDIEIILSAPDGSSIFLLADGSGASTSNSTWDISFFPCTDPVNPDGGANDIYTSSDFTSNSSYTGSYYPGDGCFSDFTGSANGEWTLQVNDLVGADIGEVTNWSITFCDGTGLSCSSSLCEAEMGSYDLGPLDFCIDDDPIIVDPPISGGQNSSDYTDTWVIVTNNAGSLGDIVDYSESGDLTGLEGSYYVCGLNYLNGEESLFPEENVGNPYSDLETLIDDGSICADTEEGCVLVFINDCGCEAEGGFFTVTNDIFCLADEIDLTAEVFDENQNPEYNYTFTIFNTNPEDLNIASLIEYSDDGIINDYEEGLYWLCGLSYLAEDESALTPIDGTNSDQDIIDDIDNEVFCGDFDSNCILFVIEEAIPEPILDFEPSICVGQASELTITNYDLDTPYDIIINSGSFSTLIPGLPTTFFTPQLDSDIEICIIAYNVCGDQEVCANITVNNASSENIEIVGNTGICPGNFENYTLSGLGSGVVNGWTISGDATIVGSTTDDNVDVQLDAVSTTGAAELCVDITTDCGDIQECFDIDIILNDVTNNTPSSFCSLDFEVSALIDGGDGVGVWTVVSAPVGSITFDDLNSSTTGATVNSVGIGDYVLRFTFQCNQFVEVPFTVFEPIEANNIVVECTGEMYTISFDIEGGTAPYTVNGVAITGNSFTSSLIDDDPYNFTIGDSSDCPDIELSGNSDCDCTSDAGTINPQDLLVSCEGETVTATSNGDTFLDGDDIGIWILYSDVADPLGSILLENTTGDFSFIAPLNYMTTYFIAYIVGNDIGGTVDLSDPCLDIASGTSIIFSEPFELTGITVDPLNSCGSEFQLTAIQVSPIAGNWGITNPTGGTSSLSNINGLSTIVTLEGIGDFVISYSTADGLCSVSEEVTISGADIPAAEVVDFECSDDNSSYTVSIEVQGGTAPYSVNGVEFSGNVFFSPLINSGDSYSYTIIDAFGCVSTPVTGTEFCDCESFAGSMSVDLEEICGEENVTAINDGNEILDGNDALIYVLHTSNNSSLGTIIDENQTGTFSFLPTMDFGTTYYISAVVGNGSGTSIDFSDDCLDVAVGQPIIWYEEIDITSIISDSDIGCDNFNLTVSTNTTMTGQWTIVSSPNGSVVTLSSNTALSTTATVDIPGTYTLQYEIINGVCIESDQVSFILSTIPVISNINYECDDQNENYLVSFDITGGTQPYSVNGETTSNIYSSTPTPNGLSIDYIVTDANGCQSEILTANFSCDGGCISDAGTMPQDTLLTCYDTLGTQPIIQVVNNGDAVLDGDDLGIYFVHYASDINIDFPIAQNTSGIFQNLGDILYNEVLLVTYVVGNEIDGTIDFEDPCISISFGQPIIFYQVPEATLGNNKSVCRLTTNIDFESSITENENLDWTVIFAPPGGILTITENASQDVDIEANLPGTYSISLTAQNDNCDASDTISIEFRAAPSVEVMSDFGSCDSEVQLFSVKSGGTGIWSIPNLPDLIFDALPDSTSVNLDTTGIFNIIRSVTENNCTTADTVQVEIYPPSEFLIEEIICDDDNENFFLNYELVGNSYPYFINGEELLEGEEIVLTAASGTNLEVSVIDQNGCEIINSTFTKSCDCESSLQINDQDLYRACIQDTMWIDPVEDFTLAEGDSLVYVFHDSNTDVITNIIAVSGSPYFLFDPVNMNTIIPYFVTAVIYNGGEFSLELLEEPCTQFDRRRPVSWYGPSQTFIEDQTFNICSGNPVSIPVIHEGQVPIIVGITTSEGFDFQIEITEEGITNVEVPITESGTVSIEYVVPFLFCENTFAGTANINIIPSVEILLVDDITVCNDPTEGNTSVILNDLILSENTSGEWTDQNGTIVLGESFFTGTTPDDYIYTYTLSDPLCGTASESIIISVIDCEESGCPTEVILPLPEVCEGGSVVSLNDYVLPEFVNQGYWTLIEGSTEILIEIPDITISEESSGSVNLFYTLPGLNPECDSTFFESIIINEAPNAGTNIQTINEFCKDGFVDIILFELIQDYDEGGIWSSEDTDMFNEITGMVLLSQLSTGIYQFNYTVGIDDDTCPEDISSVTIRILESESVAINTFDPPCFGINDGSISITDMDGNIFTNSYEIIDINNELVNDENMLAPGSYTFTSTDQNGCDILSGFIINDPLEIFLDLGLDIVIEEGDTATISSNTNVAEDDVSLYEWIVNQSTIDAPSYENLILNPDNETVVLLSITDNDGCIVSDDILISLIVEEGQEVEVILPNIFNPNNSSFGIESFEKIVVINDFLIYDRWGNNVFSAQDFNPLDNNMRWDGNYNGNEAISGVYVYYINYTDTNGEEKIIGGDITLIR